MAKETVKTTNEELKKIIAEAIASCVSCAGSAESVKHIDNPKWADVVVILDECTDELREVEQSL